MTAAKHPAGGNTIRPLRQRPSSVPLSHELYSQTADPVVIAFQVAAMFHNPSTDPPLTLDALRARWKVGRPKATTARRALIDLGFWVEVRAKDDRGQYVTETLTWDQQVSQEDLQDLALHYRPGSKIDCGGCVYRVNDRGYLDIDAGKTDHQRSVTRIDQAKRDVDAGEPDRQKTDTRRTGEPDPQKTDTPHASPLRGDEEHACMHDVLIEEFWNRVATTTAAVGRGGQNSVHRQVTTAFDVGWTPQLLADWVTGKLQEMRQRKLVRNPAGFVVAQLRDIPPLERPTEAVGSPVDKERLPACNTCGARSGEGRAYRTVDSEHGGVRKCPDCHPDTSRSTAA